MRPPPLSMVRKANQRGETRADVTLSTHDSARCGAHPGRGGQSSGGAPNPCTLISNADLQAILHQELTALVVPRHCARPSTGSGWGRSNPVFVSLDCFVVLRAPCNDDRGQGNCTGTNFVVKS
jgi:hypothetical protein